VPELLKAAGKQQIPYDRFAPCPQPRACYPGSSTIRSVPNATPWPRPTMTAPTPARSPSPPNLPSLPPGRKG
jgi:hypothetical protein